MCQYGILPIENSTAGEVGQVVDLMFKGPLYINGVYSLPVIHHLLGITNANLSDVQKKVHQLDLFEIQTILMDK